MKALLSMVLTLLGFAALGDGLTSVEINGNTYSNITQVYVGTGGRIIIIRSDGISSATTDQLPQDFLASWKISHASQDSAKAAVAAAAESNLERAILTGSFREVDGVVYDIRKPQSGWVTFREYVFNANWRCLQKGLFLKTGNHVDGSASKKGLPVKAGCRF